MARHSLKTLLLAASGSLLAHWLVLNGVGQMGSAPASEEPPQTTNAVMVAALDLQAPTLMARKPTASATAAALQAMPASDMQSPSGSVPAGINQSAATLSATDASGMPPEDARPVQTAAVSDPGPVASEPPEEPLSGKLAFRVYLGEGDGEPLALVTHTLHFGKGHYEISSRGEALGLLATLYSGLLTQRSVGTWGVNGFETLEYVEQRGKKPETRVSINQADLSASFSNGQNAALQSANAQDRLSVIYHLGQQVRGQILKPGEIRDFQVLSTSGTEDYRFTFVGMETLNMGAGAVQAGHFRRLQAGGPEKTGIEIWYDSASDALPLQIRLIDKKGLVITQKRVITALPSAH
jgi:hypothetical protein